MRRHIYPAIRLQEQCSCSRRRFTTSTSHSKTNNSTNLTPSRSFFKYRKPVTTAHAGQKLNTNSVMHSTVDGPRPPPAPSLPDELVPAAPNDVNGAHSDSGALSERCAQVYDLVHRFLQKDSSEDKRLAQVQKQVRISLRVIQEALERYSFDELSLSYNGGKDCLVLLILYLAGLHAYATRTSFSPSSEQAGPATSPRLSLPQTLPAIYILSQNPFPSVTSFVTTSAQHYCLSLASHPSPMLSAFTNHLTLHPNIRAIFVGTRRTDPHGATLTHFDPTDHNWPQFMRIHPVIDWAYVDIWKFIRELDVEYCDLYDQGYTSLGGRGDTWPNPKLRVETDGEEKFRPAYELVEDDEERLGREKR